MALLHLTEASLLLSSCLVDIR